MFTIVSVKPQGEEDKLMDQEEARGKQTHPDITTMISPVLVYIPMNFYYRKYMFKKVMNVCMISMTRHPSKYVNRSSVHCKSNPKTTSRTGFWSLQTNRAIP